MGKSFRFDLSPMSYFRKPILIARSYVNKNNDIYLIFFDRKWRPSAWNRVKDRWTQSHLSCIMTRIVPYVDDFVVVGCPHFHLLATSDHGVAGSNPAGGEILPEPKWRFIAQSLSCSPFHRLEMTEILLKGRKTLTHPSIHLLAHLSRRLICEHRIGRHPSSVVVNNFKRHLL